MYTTSVDTLAVQAVLGAERPAVADMLVVQAIVSPPTIEGYVVDAGQPVATRVVAYERKRGHFIAATMSRLAEGGFYCLSIPGLAIGDEVTRVVYS
ncbi:MAG: hypothetical protein VBE63_08495, partial [Lamprobacter sp.]|uniref:hypothetical protein n=1 Tax=Lamprobacter sp. TaxID=3100796 RepID=UPI002B26263B